jgi:hypothetical protein
VIQRAIAGIAVPEFREARVWTNARHTVDLIPVPYQLQVDAPGPNVCRLEDHSAGKLMLDAERPLVAEWLREVRIDW